MNIQEAKNIRLVDFLAGFGYEPVIQRGNSVWYKSPFRTEKEASFKVDLHKELWYDFGLGKGGDIITLAKEIYRTQDIGYVLQCIENKRAVLKPVTLFRYFSIMFRNYIADIFEVIKSDKMKIFLFLLILVYLVHLLYDLM